jgi:hypothetical protein
MSLKGQTDLPSRARISGPVQDHPRARREPSLTSRLRGQLPTFETVSIVAFTVTPLVVAACTAIG